MKKILVAMNNSSLIEQLKKCGKYDVYNYDIDTKENVIEYLNKYSADVLVTKDNLEGQLSSEEYIKKIREVNKNIKIILCVNELNELYKGFLLSNNVFDIIETVEVKFMDILSMIDSKNNMIILKDNNKLEKRKVDNKFNILTKQKICVFGTSGSGKSFFSSILAQITSKKLKLNTILVDMDIQNAAIDIYNDLTNSGNNLEYVMEEIDRGSFNLSMLQDIITKGKKNGKLSFITNNMGIYECQNKLSKDYYDKLYNETEKEYDILILDMPNAPFLDVVPFSLTKADKIFFVLNPNFISLRQAIKYLDLLTNIWKIPKDRIYIVVNKIKKESLDVKQINAILKDYDICMKIEDNNDVEAIINGLKELDVDMVDKEDNLKNLFDIFVDNSGKDILEKLGVLNDS